MGTLEFQNVGKVYAGGVRAVSGVNLKIREGEFIVLVGPSGCGKSTILRMTAGLEGITEGLLLLDGKVINSLSPVERDISVVFQDYALYPQLTVYDNVGMSLKLRHQNDDAIFEKVISTSKFLQIQGYLSRLPGQLSGGQKQRVSLGRAIARQPKVFLMDEPLSNLDAKLRAHTRSEIVRVQKQLGVTTLYVTHDQIEAMTMADRIVVIYAGIVQQIGTPKEIYDNPRNLFVAGFIGTPPMNFLKGQIDRGSFVCGTDCIALPDRWKKGAFEGKKVVLGIRPEAVKFVSSGCAGIEVSVELVEFLGCNSQVFMRMGQNQIVGIAKTFDKKITHAKISFDMEKAHLFDAETTMKLED